MEDNAASTPIAARDYNPIDPPRAGEWVRVRGVAAWLEEEDRPTRPSSDWAGQGVRTKARLPLRGLIFVLLLAATLVAVFAATRTRRADAPAASTRSAPKNAARTQKPKAPLGAAAASPKRVDAAAEWKKTQTQPEAQP